MYKILGADGNEYESISAEKIRQWIREGRVDKKTPAMPEDAADWVFLGEMPEFVENFASVQKQEIAVSAQKKRRRMTIGLGVFLAVAAVAFFVLKLVKHH